MPVLRTISWSANVEADVSSYTLYAGTRTGVYDDANSPKVMGNVTTGTFLAAHNSTRFYALTASDTESLESAFSAEVEFLPDVAFFA